MRIAPHLTLLAGLAGCFQSAGLGLDGNAQDSICPPGQTLCRGVCVDLETDTENCGMCGYACEAGHNCSGGICRAECEDMCGSAMAHRCSSDRAGVEICGDYDLDGCLEWSDPIPCPSGTACVGGDCRGSELVCGDGIVEAPEECDDGEGNSDAIPDACRTDCRLAYCGDGVCDSSEHCTGCPSDCGECYDLCHPENYNGHDYLFCLSEVAWQDALDLCAGAGFHLITVNDYPEQFWASNAALAGSGNSDRIHSGNSGRSSVTMKGGNETITANLKRGEEKDAGHAKTPRNQGVTKSRPHPGRGGQAGRNLGKKRAAHRGGTGHNKRG